MKILCCSERWEVIHWLRRKVYEKEGSPSEEATPSLVV